jgi:hypothetical protein
VATETIFYSAINPSTNYSGKAFLKVKAKVEFLVSPSRLTIYFSTSTPPSLLRASP